MALDPCFRSGNNDAHACGLPCSPFNCDNSPHDQPMAALGLTWLHPHVSLGRTTLDALPVDFPHIRSHFSPTTTTWPRGRRSRGPSKCSGSHSAVRPLAASPNSGGHKVGHNFEPAQAAPGHQERDARHKNPAQAGCSRFQPQAPKPLKSLGSASSPWVQIPLPPHATPSYHSLGRSGGLLGSVASAIENPKMAHRVDKRIRARLGKLCRQLEKPFHLPAQLQVEDLDDRLVCLLGPRADQSGTCLSSGAHGSRSDGGTISPHNHCATGTSPP